MSHFQNVERVIMRDGDMAVGALEHIGLTRDSEN